MNTIQHSLRRRARLSSRLRAPSLSAAFTALVFATVLAIPASAGTTKVSAVGVFNEGCQAPVGNPPDNTGDYPPIDLSGNLAGCWYTYVTDAKFTPSGAYLEQGNELFIGCLNGSACGTFTTTYTFTGKYAEDGSEIHGRCEHSIVDGSGDFAGAKGVINFKDDVVNMAFDLRGQIMLASPGGQSLATSAAKAGDTGLTRTGGC